MRGLRVALVLLLIVVAGLVGGYWYERGVILTGNGYAAHNACAVTEIAGRDNPDEDLTANPLKPLLRTKVEDGVATATGLGFIGAKMAWFTPGFGCTVADSRPQLGDPTAVSTAGNPIATAPIPPEGPLSEAIGWAFGDDLAPAEKQELGTRAIVVIKNGKLIAERYAPGFDKDTPQLGWSMTKSVANLLTGRLVAQDKVSLDDSHLRPEWTDERATITIRHLLQMTSGLAWNEVYDLDTPVTRMLFLNPDMGAYVASQELLHSPGKFLQYSTGSTTLLCSVLAPKNGGADFPRRELFAPLGLASAVLEPDATGTPVCGSYMWATPRDWAALGQFALDDGVWNGQRLLPEGWMAESVKPVSAPEIDQAGYASGWWSNQDVDGNLMKPRLPADAFFAEGHDGQRIIIVPSEGLVLVRMGFTAAGNDRALPLAVAVIDALR